MTRDEHTGNPTKSAVGREKTDALFGRIREGTVQKCPYYLTNVCVCAKLQDLKLWSFTELHPSDGYNWTRTRVRAPSVNT